MQIIIHNKVTPAYFESEMHIAEQHLGREIKIRNIPVPDGTILMKGEGEEIDAFQY